MRQTITIISTLAVCYFLSGTNGCFKQNKSAVSRVLATTKPTPATTTNPLSPASASRNDGLAKYAKYSSSGFYIEVEEGLDKSVRIHQIKKLPPIYSQTLSKDTKIGIGEGNGGESNVKEIVEPDAPPIESLVTEDGDAMTAEDAAVNADWGGDCDSEQWKHCNKLERIVVLNVYNKTVGRDMIWQHLDLDCLLEPVVCLRNGWTTNRCHIICMSKCNSEILIGWDTFVSYEGACRYVRK